MPFIVIDTETSGLMDFKRSAELEGQPRIAEFGAALLDEQLNVVETFRRLVRRDGWSMEPEATKINGITDEILDQHGQPIDEVLDYWERQISAGYEVVTFNAQFDCKMLRAELRRAGRDDLFYQTRNSCLMRESRPWAKTIGRRIDKLGFKEDGVTPVSQGGFPKLSDLCAFLGVIQIEKHNALDDVMATHQCLLKMIELGYQPDPRVHESKNLEEIRSAK